MINEGKQKERIMRRHIDFQQEIGIKKPPKIGGAVPGTGIEPAHSCERQILSLLRLPIPPPGLFCEMSTVNRVAILMHSLHSSQNPVEIFFLKIVFLYFQ